MRMLSGIASNMLGSAGGWTFFNGPFHQIQVRQRTVPVQPNTNNQQFSKSAFSAAVAAWNNASGLLRQGWNAYAQTVTYSGPLGSYHPTGRMLAVAQYQITGYLRDAFAIILTGGVSMSATVKTGQLVLSTPQLLDLAAPGIGFGLGITNPNSEDVVAYASRSHNQNPSRNFFKGPFLSATTDSDDIATTTSGLIEFTGLVLGAIYFVKLRLIGDLEGRRISQELILRVEARETTI